MTLARPRPAKSEGYGDCEKERIIKDRSSLRKAVSWAVEGSYRGRRIQPRPHLLWCKELLFRTHHIRIVCPTGLPYGNPLLSLRSLAPEILADDGVWDGKVDTVSGYFKLNG